MANKTVPDVTRYLAVSGDRLPRYFGYEGAAGHALMIPTGFQGDPLAADNDIRRVCGGTTDVRRLNEKFSGDKKCKRCESKITDKMIDDAEYDRNREEYEEAARILVADVADPDAGRLTLDDAITAADGMRFDTIRPGVEIKWTALKSDPRPLKVEKCAVKGTDKVEPKPGTDTDGINGTCPVCQTFAKLTGKGFIGAHKINNEPTPANPEMGQKSVPAVETGARQGDTSDAAKRREGEAYTVTGRGKNKTVTPNVPTTTAGQAPIGQRDHGALDGPGMLPRGTYANGMRPDPKIVKEEMAGGRFGTLTKTEVGKLSRSQQRSYWRKVAKRRNG